MHNFGHVRSSEPAEDLALMVDHTRQIQGLLEVLCVGVNAQGKEHSSRVPMHKANPEVGGCGPP